jgi:aminopeptidase-like protein
MAQPRSDQSPRPDDGAATADLPDGEALLRLMTRLYPICRSITGQGVRDTLRILGEIVPLEVHEVPTGTPVLDWTVPREWVIRDAWVKDATGRRIVDFQRSNLEVVNYSGPVLRTIGLAELREHLHSMPDRPDWVPHRTSYYRETWGFCAPHRVVESLPEGDYEVCVDAELIDGSLTYGEFFVPGTTSDEVLVSTHVCHPSLANDNLSGMVVAAHLAAWVRTAPRRHGYRFLFIPGTIGSITWLSRNEAILPRIRHGLVLAGLGDRGSPTYKRTIGGRADIDRIVEHVLGASGEPHRIVDYEPWGYDERQFNSPGFRLPVGLLSRTPHGTYPEYHTSADDLDFVVPDQVVASLALGRTIVETIEHDRRWRNLSPKGEPQLGRRGLYGSVGGRSGLPASELSILWVLALSDGTQSLLDISERSGLGFAEISTAADALAAVELLAPAD